MASEFSKAVLKRIARYADTTDYHNHSEAQGEKIFCAEVDAELQEVRDVLLSTARHKDGEGLPCWCVVMMRTMPHMEHCQRARDLMQQLEVRP